MNMAGSTGYSVAAMPAFAGRGLLRWAVLGAAGVIALILALTHSTVAGAQAPANCIPINYGTCVVNGTAFTTGTVGTPYVAPNTGLPGNAPITAPYFDNRYGFVQVVTDSSGNLIDINPQTGQRIFPFLPDFGIGGVIGNGVIGANFVNGGVIPPGTANGITCNGLYGCPFGGGFIGNGTFNNGFNGINGNFVNGGVFNNGVFNNGFNGFNGNVFNNGVFNGGFFNNNGAFPAGATNIGGGVFTYNDNRFCGDGKLFFVVGRGSFCQNGGNGFANFRGFEVNTTTPQQASTVTTYAAPAAPKAAAPVVAQAAAPVVQAAAPVVQTVIAPQAAAPVVQAVVAPKAPVTAPAVAAPIVAKVQTMTPAAKTSGGATEPDNHRG